MTDPPKLPVLKPMRSRRPSLPDLWDDLSTSHRIDSDPPGARWLDRRIGRAVRVSAWWLFRTKAGTAFAAGVGAAATWASHHFLHWIH